MGLELRWPREAHIMGASGLTHADDAQHRRQPRSVTPGLGGKPEVSARDVTPQAGCGEAGVKQVVGPPSLQSPLQSPARPPQVTERPADTLHRYRLLSCQSSCRLQLHGRLSVVDWWHAP